MNIKAGWAGTPCWASLQQHAATLFRLSMCGCPTMRFSDKWDRITVFNILQLFYKFQSQYLQPIRTKPIQADPMMMPRRRCRSMICNSPYCWLNLGKPTTFLRKRSFKAGMPPFQFLATTFNFDQRSGRCFWSQSESMAAFRINRMLHIYA